MELEEIAEGRLAGRVVEAEGIVDSGPDAAAFQQADDPTPPWVDAYEC